MDVNLQRSVKQTSKISKTITSMNSFSPSLSHDLSLLSHDLARAILTSVVSRYTASDVYVFMRRSTNPSLCVPALIASWISATEQGEASGDSSTGAPSPVWKGPGCPQLLCLQ